MDEKTRLLLITRTAIFIALLIVLQAATAALGNVFITGSVVNMLLIIAVMTCGLPTGLLVSVISPVVAKFFGIGPLWSLIPFIALGNLTLILIWHFVCGRKADARMHFYVIAMITAAVSKFLVLFIGIVKIAVPVFLRLPPQQATIISGMFSFPQLATAALGGAVAAVILPRLKKAIQTNR